MKTMKQPRKDVLREQLALAADEIIRLRAHVLVLETMSRRIVMEQPAPLWRRLLGAFR